MMLIPQKDNTDFVAKYRREGLNVIPCRVPQPNEDREIAKKPAINWKQCQEKPFDGSIDKDANIAIICGRGSGNLVVVDIDKSDLDLVNEIYPDALKKTRVVKTGSGGYHVNFKVYKLPKTLRLNKPNGDHIDVQSEGTYVIAPPSIHPNGNEYKIISETEEIIKIDFQEIIVNLEKAGFRPDRQIMSSQELSKGGIEKGNRHTSAIRYANLLLLSKGLNEETMRYEMKQWNHTLPEPLPQQELERIVNDCVKYSKGKPKKKRKDDEENNHTELADTIRSNYNFKTLRETEEVLVYEHGIYVRYGKITIKEESERLAYDCYNNLVAEVIGHIQRSTSVPQNAFDNYPMLLNLPNGILNIETKEKKDHNPELLFRIQLPVNYNPNAKAEKIMKFLNEILEPDYVEWVLDFMAYCLVKNCEQEKAMMFVGEGGNGKGTLIKLIARFLGLSNVSNHSIQELIENRFARADLDSKLANMYADIDSNEMKKVGILKILTSGDAIRVERKNQDSYDLVSFAKLIFSANMMPDVDEASVAFYDRWLIIDFVNRFRDTKEENTKLIGEITTDGELSGLLNIVMERMPKLLTNKKVFKNAPSGYEMMRNWKDHANSIESFNNNQIEIVVGEIMRKKDLFNIYLLYCRNRNFSAFTEKTFSLRLNKILAGRIEDTAKRIHGKSTRVWMNIKVRDMPKSLGSEGATQTRIIDDDNYYGG